MPVPWRRGTAAPAPCPNRAKGSCGPATSSQLASSAASTTYCITHAACSRARFRRRFRTATVREWHQLLSECVVDVDRRRLNQLGGSTDQRHVRDVPFFV